MNVILFVLDTLRSDHLGCYGYFRETSPHMDRLAAEGVLFEDSYASAIATGPGFTSLLTGRAAINHGFGVSVEPFVLTSMASWGILSTLLAGQVLALVSMIWTYRLNVVEEIARS